MWHAHLGDCLSSCLTFCASVCVLFSPLHFPLGKAVLICLPCQFYESVCHAEILLAYKRSDHEPVIELLSRPGVHVYSRYSPTIHPLGKAQHPPDGIYLTKAMHIKTHQEQMCFVFHDASHLLLSFQASNKQIHEKLNHYPFINTDLLNNYTIKSMFKL